MHSRRLINVSIMVILLAMLALPMANQPAAAESPQKGLDKVEALVLEELATQGQTDFFIWMAEKADLSPAAQLVTKL